MPEDRRWPGSVELGRRIVEARRRVAATREELATLAGVDLSNLGRIERGTINPSFYTLVRIAVSLGIDPGDLVRGIGEDMLPPRAEVLTVQDYARAKRGHDS